MSDAAADLLVARLRALGAARRAAPPRVADPTLARLVAAGEARGGQGRPAPEWLAVAVPAGLAAALVGAALLPPSAADRLLAPSVGAGAEALARLLERLGDPPR